MSTNDELAQHLEMQVTRNVTRFPGGCAATITHLSREALAIVQLRQDAHTARAQYSFEFIRLFGVAEIASIVARNLQFELFRKITGLQ